MQKLQLSRAAQAAAVQALASTRPSSSPWISGMTSGLAPRQAPPLDLGGGAAAALASPPLPCQPALPSAGGSGAPHGMDQVGADSL